MLNGIVSVGIALSHYVRTPDYSKTESRRIVLWLEFDRPVENPSDAYFARVLQYAPDPLLYSTPEIAEEHDPPFPIDPEPIRIIVPNQSDDKAGINAMQKLVPSDTSPNRFMVPLEAGGVNENFLHTS
jgi:hypothetical protein